MCDPALPARLSPPDRTAWVLRSPWIRDLWVASRSRHFRTGAFLQTVNLSEVPLQQRPEARHVCCELTGRPGSAFPHQRLLLMSAIENLLGFGIRLAKDQLGFPF